MDTKTKDYLNRSRDPNYATPHLDELTKKASEEGQDEAALLNSFKKGCELMAPKDVRELRDLDYFQAVADGLNSDQAIVYGKAKRQERLDLFTDQHIAKIEAEHMSQCDGEEAEDPDAAKAMK